MASEEKQRTSRQNRALHKFFTQLATALNEAGLDQRKTLAPEIEIPWTPAAVKNMLWRPIQSVQLQKVSTTDLTTKEIDLVYDTLNLFLGKHGIHVPFPSFLDIMYDDSI